MRSTPDDLLALFRRHLPRRAGTVALMFSSSYPEPVWRDESGHLRAALMLVFYDGPEDDAPADVREQEVYLGDDRVHAPARLQAWLEGTLRALPAILAGYGEGASSLLPCDLFAYGGLLADQALQTADDFAAVFGDPARLAALNEAAREAEWREQLAPLGLAEHVAAVRALARPSLRLHLEPDAQDVDEDEDGEHDSDDEDGDDVEDAGDGDDSDVDDDDDGHVDEDDEDGDDVEDGDDGEGAGDDGDSDVDDDDVEDAGEGEDGDVDEDGADATWPIGQTRFGGAPDLPPDLPWPEEGGVPLTFVAQFDLAELAKWPAARELPQSGLLSFFYAPIPPDGVRGHPVRVLHFTGLADLARRPVPADVETLRAHAIDVDEEEQFPAVDSYFFYESLLPDERVLACHRGRQQGTGEELVPFTPLAYFVAGAERLGDPERPFHRLLGHPASIQGDPYLDVEIDTRAQGWDGWEDGSPEALQIRRQALRWRLLLQIDASERDGLLLNQDGGFFYFWIPADALARHDWSQARGALQCH